MLRGRLTLIAVVFFAVMGIFYFSRDLRLSDIGIPVEMPDVVVENLNFARTMDGRDWQMTAKSAEHTAGVVRAVSIDLSMVSEQKAQRARMSATDAAFYDSKGEIHMSGLSGNIFTSKRSIDIRSNRAIYYRSADRWLFEEGLEIVDKKILLRGKEAEFTKNGVFSLRKGAYARWKIK